VIHAHTSGSPITLLAAAGAGRDRIERFRFDAT
jgi:hypothetical protein